jgi:hypothetical protein
MKTAQAATVAVVALLASACTGALQKAKTTLDGLDLASNRAQKFAEHEACKPALEACKEQKPPELAGKPWKCDALEACKAQRLVALKAIYSLKAAIAVAYGSLLVVEKPELETVIGAVLGAMDDVLKAIQVLRGTT